MVKRTNTEHLYSLVNSQNDLCWSVANVTYKDCLCYTVFDGDYGKNNLVRKVQNRSWSTGKYWHNVLLSICFTHDVIVVVLVTVTCYSVNNATQSVSKTAHTKDNCSHFMLNKNKQQNTKNSTSSFSSNDYQLLQLFSFSLTGVLYLHFSRMSQLSYAETEVTDKQSSFYRPSVVYTTQATC